jgi:hypothetical protein
MIPTYTKTGVLAAISFRDGYRAKFGGVPFCNTSAHVFSDRNPFDNTDPRSCSTPSVTVIFRWRLHFRLPAAFHSSSRLTLFRSLVM